jgi:beta-lactamase class A
LKPPQRSARRSKHPPLLNARAHVARIAREFRGDMGVYVEDADTLEGFGVDEHALYPLASVCKLPLMVTLYRQAERRELSLRRRIKLGAARRVGGSGLLQYMQPGIAPSVRDLIIMMIAVSDNEATDTLFRIASPRAVTREMASLGLKQIRLNRPIGPLITRIRAIYAPKFAAKSYAQQKRLIDADPEIFERTPKARVWREMHRIFDGRDCASAKDTARLCSMLQRGELAPARRSADMLSILDMQCFNTGLPRLLPDRASVAHKTGSWDGVANDAGIITLPASSTRGAKRRISVAVYTWARNVETFCAREAIGKIGRAVWDAFY